MISCAIAVCEASPRSDSRRWQRKRMSLRRPWSDCRRLERNPGIEVKIITQTRDRVYYRRKTVARGAGLVDGRTLAGEIAVFLGRFVRGIEREGLVELL